MTARAVREWAEELAASVSSAALRPDLERLSDRVRLLSVSVSVSGQGHDARWSLDGEVRELHSGLQGRDGDPSKAISRRIANSAISLGGPPPSKGATAFKHGHWGYQELCRFLVRKSPASEPAEEVLAMAQADHPLPDFTLPLRQRLEEEARALLASDPDPGATRRQALRRDALAALPARFRKLMEFMTYQELRSLLDEAAVDVVLRA